MTWAVTSVKEWNPSLHSAQPQLTVTHNLILGLRFSGSLLKLNDVSNTSMLENLGYILMYLAMTKRDNALAL